MIINFLGKAIFDRVLILRPDIIDKIKKENSSVSHKDIGYIDKVKANFAELPGTTFHKKWWGLMTQDKFVWLNKFSIDNWNKQKGEPVKLEILSGADSYWIFQDNIVSVSDADFVQAEDIMNHIKLFIYKRESEFKQIREEVERFEQFEKIKPVQREQIPEDVRMYVWRRDNGKCITCGTNRNLEFDHIIPVSEGGSNTERNIQLLCADCNKKKSNKI